MTYPYFIETYTDQYHTLTQSFIISQLEIDQTDGLALSLFRSQINPNLTHHYSTTYLDNDQFPVLTEYYDQDYNIIKTVNHMKGD